MENCSGTRRLEGRYRQKNCWCLKNLCRLRETGRYPCDSGVESNSVLCPQCNKWVHNRCCGHASFVFVQVQDFRCTVCVQPPRAFSSKAIEMNYGTNEELGKFCYLGDVLDREWSADAAVRPDYQQLKLNGRRSIASFVAWVSTSSREAGYMKPA